MTTVKVEVKHTPKEMAELLWQMYSDDQAEMFKHLYDLAGGEHHLMMQFMCTRDHCEKRGDESLAAFQALFSSAYKYMSV
ncbi:MAG: hypothetical protein GY775_16085 [Candidatus Scalindua sp.]|nr:hypothetical protein [Candidatus Scalindua sp.]